MSSITLTLTGNSSRLQADYFPAIDLSDGSYVCGLIDFQTFNSIPNIDEKNNLFYFGYEKLENNREMTDNSENYEENDINRYQPLNEIHKDKRTIGYIPQTKKQPLTCINIPTGSYEVEHLSNFLRKRLEEKGAKFKLEANKNTLQCELFCDQPIDFSKSNTIGPLLGFSSNKVLQEKKLNVSPLPADILKISVIRVECNNITGSYLNNKPSHTIHEFSPRVPPGYKIIVPQNVIYFPVTVKSIHTLNLTLLDQLNNLINFEVKRSQFDCTSKN